MFCYYSFRPQDSKKEASERKSSDSTIDMKLAVPHKEKPQIDKNSKTPEELELESDLGESFIRPMLDFLP